MRIASVVLLYTFSCIQQKAAVTTTAALALARSSALMEQNHASSRRYRVPYLGHAGILFIEGKTGLSEYFEYGRYGGPLGAVQKRTIPDVRMGKNDRPSRASMEKTLGEISRLAGRVGVSLAHTSSCRPAASSRCAAMR